MPDEKTVIPLRHGQVKQAIADLIKELPRGMHLTAPEVYRAARGTGLNVSLSTVYRTLNELQAHGDVNTLGSDRGRRYEPAGDEDHDHLICLKCGLTIEFYDDLIHGFGKSVAQRKGFEHRSSRFDILGLCADCKAKDEDHLIESAVSLLEGAIEAMEEATAMCRQAVLSFETRKTGKGRASAEAAAERLASALASCQDCVNHFKPDTSE